jgi:hypothetical protein
MFMLLQGPLPMKRTIGSGRVRHKARRTRLRDDRAARALIARFSGFH